MKTALGILGRYLLVWLVYLLGLLLASSLVPGFRIETSEPHWWTVLLVLPVQLAALVILLRPLLLLATLPLNSLTLGFPTLFFNGIILWLVAVLNPAIVITHWWNALVGAAVLTVVTTSVVGWLGLDEAYPLYQALIYRLARRFGRQPEEGFSRGVLLLQIDGLSHTSLRRALERGRMPSVSGLLARGSHRLVRWSCGVPSNTPAVQAGMLYGDRFDVPGYRWYDREARQVRVVNNPADVRLLEERASAAGTPLLKDGSCIGSILSGGAAKRLMTVSAVGDGRSGERADFNLFFLSPYAYPRAVLASIWDYLAGFVQAVLGRLFTDRPRLRFNPRRLAQRSVANAFLRETAQFWIKQDMVRGVPVIYSNFVGYDDVSHYSDPDAYDAQVSLAAFDRLLRRLRRLARGRRGFAYDVVLLSDHGHTPSIPFRIIYGHTLEAEIAEVAGAVVREALSPDPVAAHVSVLLREMEHTGTGRFGWAVDRGRATLARISRDRQTPAPAGTISLAEAEIARARVPEPSDRGHDSLLAGSGEPRIVVCVSGSLAHVYFADSREPLHLEQVRQLIPGLVERLARHPGVAFVAASRDRGDAVAIGSGGIRNLITGQIVGDEDPLEPFGETGFWSDELAQLMSYPSAGDLVIQGAWWPERDRVVVFEEQTSSHGGLGGRQVEPFLIVPAWWGTREDDLRSPEALGRHFRANLKRYRPS
ncbi:MAG: phage holin family protein [Candidatus Krumholzibacteriia bacterium]